MTEIDTSAETVERVAGVLENEAAHMNRQASIDAMHRLAATLRALARERDEAREARTVAIQQMCEHARAAGARRDDGEQ